MFDLNTYLLDPCRVSSIPYWKAKAISVPADMFILHQEDFEKSTWAGFLDQTYFRLRHNLQDIHASVLSDDYSLCDASLADFAAHMNDCYGKICVTESELLGYTKRSVYDGALWLAVRDDRTGEIVATGIAEADREVGEGMLEWIQVSEKHRRRGLGRFLVHELLLRMQGRVQFATVSGRCDHPTCPEKLYRNCGFSGADVWHILRKTE